MDMNLAIAIELGLTIIALVIYAIRQEHANKTAHAATAALINEHMEKDLGGTDRLGEALKELQACHVQTMEAMKALREGQMELHNLCAQTARLQKESIELMAQIRKESAESEKSNLMAHTEMLALARGSK